MITRSESELIARERSNLSAQKTVRVPQGALERQLEPRPIRVPTTEQSRHRTSSD